MQLDRLIARTMIRVAKSGFIGLRLVPESDVPPAATCEIRGSGSWCGLSRITIPSPDFAAPPADRAIPKGGISARPLMSARDVKLLNWISDRLEVEAPCCTVHARVALTGFLSDPSTRDKAGPLTGKSVDLLIMDKTGRAVVALLQEHGRAASPQEQTTKILQEAGVPVVRVPKRLSRVGLWSAIAQTLPCR